MDLSRQTQAVRRSPCRFVVCLVRLSKTACGASRLLDAKTPDIEAARRRDALARWRKARASGLTAKTAAEIVAYCPVAKWTVAKAYRRATAAAASLFLDKLQAAMPFKVEAIQVEGGSEFMAQFEPNAKNGGSNSKSCPPSRRR